MHIYIRIKAVGKRRDVLQPIPYTIPDDIKNLRQLLTSIVRNEAERYNQKETDIQVIPFLTAEQIDDRASAGKVSFGTVFTEKKVNVPSAVENAVQCWQDGLVRVFMNETELTEMDEPLSIPENAEFTFIRLTFLAGRMW